MYTAIAMLTEDIFEFDVHISTHSSKEEAETIANSASSFSLVFHNSQPAIKLRSQQKLLFRFDTEVFIRQMRKEKIFQLGLPLPLDMRDPTDAQIAIDVKKQDPVYVLEDKDYILSSRTLSYFLDLYGEGKSLESFAYAAVEVTAYYPSV